jgi:hypothetical protein
VTRRVPEFALLTGLVLAGATGAFALWATGRLHQSLLTALLLLYPFAAYAVHRDDDPTNVLVPSWVAVAGLAVGAIVVLDVLWQARSGLAAAAVRGLFLGSLAAAPTLGYAVRYDRSLGPSPRAVRAVAVAAAVLFPLIGVIGATWYGAGTGLLWGLGGGLYADRRGLWLSRRQRGGAVVAGLRLGAVLVVGGLAVGGVARLPLLLSAVGLLATPALFFALTVDSTAF